MSIRFGSVYPRGFNEYDCLILIKEGAVGPCRLDLLKPEPLWLFVKIHEAKSNKENQHTFFFLQLTEPVI